MDRADEIAQDTFDRLTSLYDIDNQHDVAIIAEALRKYRKEGVEEDRKKWETVADAAREVANAKINSLP